MHSTGPFTETNQTKRIRYTIVAISICSVVLAFMVQNQLLLSMTKGQEDQQLMITSSVRPNAMTKVAMIKNKDNQSFLVLYEVDQESYKFTTTSFLEIQTPINSILYDQQNRLWINQQKKWYQLNTSLEKIDSVDSPPVNLDNSEFKLKSTKKENVYKTVLQHNSDIVWSKTFNSNPIQTVSLNEKQGVWIVLFEDGETKIVSPT
ncbi:hypothetical protein GLW08_07545 [Pontibacillus yanchengensis]|uniref:Uncharacterized protein n=1 Tax=Pontibacillus yanchengensis TaxID=462910 RepID=A0ACC7VG49_9BACI|nr:hypothetical protein [Pontibacillus yanchengensis]MYL53191.1 hypothetical protein [Pontibacillus yanchengensis]